MSSHSSFSSLEEEYTPEYCLDLEKAYGTGMMSEGGREGIEQMFMGIPLKEKKALDIGSGLGGVVFYLAEKYAMTITGLEVNPWMVKESQKRTPEVLKENVNFILSESNTKWPLAEMSFDIIYSKGVLTHVEKKAELFRECHRLLKQDGMLVITDWLSSNRRGWGAYIRKLVELEKLVLFPETESGYVDLLQESGFQLLSVRDDSAVYRQYNQNIIDRLIRMKEETDDCTLDAPIQGYHAIVKAIQVGELRIIRFIAKKKTR